MLEELRYFKKNHQFIILFEKTHMHFGKRISNIFIQVSINLYGWI